MELAQAIFTGGALAVVGTLVTVFINSQTKDLKSELRATRTELKADIAEVKLDVKDLRVEMNERFRDQGKEISALRTDVTQLALALGSRPQPQAG
jgi:hypothetical protein